MGCQAQVTRTDPTQGADDRVMWACAGQATGVQAGQCAPEFALDDAAGVVHRLSSMRGYVTLLDLSAMWCPTCQRLARETAALEAAVAGEGVRVVTVLYEDTGGNNPDAADLRAWSSAYGLDHLVLADNNHAVRNTWGGAGQPILIVIDRDGRVTWRTSGYPGQATVVQQLRAAM